MARRDRCADGEPTSHPRGEDPLGEVGDGTLQSGRACRSPGETCGDADDVFVDHKRRRVYVSYDEGVVDVLEPDEQGYR